MGVLRLVYALKFNEALLARFAVKASVAGGFTYYTIREGLWSDPEETVKLYGRMYNNIAPYVKRNIPKEVATELPELPSVTDITCLVKSSWNKGVITTFKFISNLPEHTSNAIEASGIKGAILSAIDSVNTPEKPAQA
ncbi:MICOS complex subunit MIC13 homolog QIL1 isoform X1 [Neodiprion lecontei]|uniref:MICOS complex subunit MIC13 n=1 Tax=Neodiprion lecontei TaxID=441921 RepID=A0ABM3FEE7_NEOLC|nr:MICOS complex subunit MIC13 homolog QIL1 isoform X1 [Neodiprion lecontei]